LNKEIIFLKKKIQKLEVEDKEVAHKVKELAFETKLIAYRDQRVITNSEFKNYRNENIAHQFENSRPGNYSSQQQSIE
jgi:hypothetical protein